MHHTGLTTLQVNEVASQVEISPGAVSQALLSLTETPYAVLSLLVQLLQLPVPVVEDDELL
jgi:hypothetical protein